MKFFWFAFTVVLLSAAMGTARVGFAATPPNVVFIYADDLGYGDLACHGHPEIQTPHLDRLAAEGTDFQSFTVANPVCSPSRVAILTGHHPSRYGIHQHFATPAMNAARNMPNFLDPAAPLLPRELQNAGYKTAHYGKWHLGGVGAPPAAEYGYDDAATYTGADRHVFSDTPYASMKDAKAAHDDHAASFLSVAATDHAVRFLREHHEQPIYINLWLHETHHLVSATEDDMSIYPDTPQPQRTYYAAVSRADRQVGRILQTLDELELAEKTIVIFSSDNGPENSHPNPGDKFYYSVGSTGDRAGRKRSLQFGGVGTPLLVRWPGVVPAGRVDTKTAFNGVDFFPTLLSLLSLEMPAGYVSDGEDLSAAMRGQDVVRRKPLFWYWQGTNNRHSWPQFSIRDGDYYLQRNDELGRTELYDLVTDPRQKTDLSSKQKERVRRMNEKLDAWAKSLDLPVQSRMTEAVRQDKPGGGRKKTPSASNPREALFKRVDRDGSGMIERQEFISRGKNADELIDRFDRLDRNDDQKLTPDEFVRPNRS